MSIAILIKAPLYVPKCIKIIIIACDILKDSLAYGLTVLNCELICVFVILDYRAVGQMPLRTSNAIIDLLMYCGMYKGAIIKILIHNNVVFFVFYGCNQKDIF